MLVKITKSCASLASSSSSEVRHSEIATCTNTTHTPYTMLVGQNSILVLFLYVRAVVFLLCSEQGQQTLCLTRNAEVKKSSFGCACKGIVLLHQYLVLVLLLLFQCVSVVFSLSSYSVCDLYNRVCWLAFYVRFTRNQDASTATSREDQN